MISWPASVTSTGSRYIWGKLFFLLLVGTAAWVAHYPDLRHWFVAVCLAASGVQFYLYRKAKWTIVEVLAGAVLLRLVFIPLPPIFSDDVFRYLWDGWLVLEGINPFLYRPSEIATAIDRPPVDFYALNSPEFYSIYPPTSQVLFALGYFLSAVTGSTIGMKIVFSALEMAAVLVMAQFASPRKVMLYAWFPLVLLVTAGQAHTDAALVLFLVLTVWSVKRGWVTGAHLALTLATWTKLYPILLFPWLIKRLGWKKVWIPVLASVALWAPFAHSSVPANFWSSLQLYGSYFEFNAGLYYVLSYLAELFGAPDATQIVGWILLATLPLVLLLIYQQGLKEWPFARLGIWVSGAYLIFTTTVHPWYFLGLLAFVPFIVQTPVHWLWISTLSVGTYLWYTHAIYASFVTAAWAGGAVIYLWTDPHIRTWLLRRRAHWKADRIGEQSRFSADQLILDLGSGEGYVGEEIARRTGAAVQLLDVSNINHTDLPHEIYNGERIPFDDNTFDATILAYVLHHAKHPENVLREALRVTGGEIILLENTVESGLQKNVVEGLDRIVNRYRTNEPGAFESHLKMRSRNQWRKMIHRSGAEIVSETHTGTWWAPNTIFRLLPTRITQ